MNFLCGSTIPEIDKTQLSIRLTGVLSKISNLNDWISTTVHNDSAPFGYHLKSPTAIFTEESITEQFIIANTKQFFSAPNYQLTYRGYLQNGASVNPFTAQKLSQTFEYPTETIKRFLSGYNGQLSFVIVSKRDNSMYFWSGSEKSNTTVHFPLALLSTRYGVFVSDNPMALYDIGLAEELCGSSFQFIQKIKPNTLFGLRDGQLMRCFDIKR